MNDGLVKDWCDKALRLAAIREEFDSRGATGRSPTQPTTTRAALVTKAAT